MTTPSELYLAASRILTEYARAADDHDEPALAAILAANVSIQRGDAFLEGREEFLQVFRNAWNSGFIVSKHFVHNLQVDPIDPVTARCQAYFQAITTKADGSNMMIGRYDDTITLEDGRWKLQTKRNLLQAVIPLPPSSEEYAGIKVNPNA